MRSWSVALTGSILVVCGVVGGCNTATIKMGGNTGGGGNGAGSGGAGGPGSGGTTMPANTPCENLSCKQSTCTKGSCMVQACPGGARTTVSGQVFDPAGKVPLYNITLYVPNKPLAPIADGPSCDPCDQLTGTSLLSGSPVTVTRSDVAGKFVLGAASSIGGDVPSGDNIPLVIQVGKWQRMITLAHVDACKDNPITDTNLTRLPRTQAEGHIPKMALTTGEADSLECLLRKVGIADSEFTPETGTGRVNLYAGGGGVDTYDPSLNGGAMFTPVHPWWDSLDNLKKYDIILHSCEGGQGTYNGNGMPPSVKSPQATQALQDFADMGGRVFASHWHAYWFENGPPAFQSIATFNHRAGLPNPYDATIETGFATGAALGQWMTNVGGSTMPGVVTIAQTANTRMVDQVAGGNISQRWIYASTLQPQSVQYLSATTPIPGGHCGRVVFSDLHVSTATNNVALKNPFPQDCTMDDLSPQEKVLEFMLFDIASCVSPLIP